MKLEGIYDMAPSLREKQVAPASGKAAVRERN